MRLLGRQAARRFRPHVPQECPLRCRGRHQKLALFARTAPAHSVSGVDAPSPRTRQAQQLVWSGHAHRQNGRHHQVSGGDGSNGRAPDRIPSLRDAADAPARTAAALNGADQEAAVELMRRIKRARSWQQLQSIVDDDLLSMNHLHVSAVVTHMAQLHASSSSNDSGPSNSGSGKRHTSNARKGSNSIGDLTASGSLDGFVHHLDSSKILHARLSGVSPSATATASGTRAGPHSADSHLHQRPLGLNLPLHDAAYAAGSRLQPWEHPLQAGPHLSAHQPLPLPPGDARSAFLQRLEFAVASHLFDFEGRQLANTLWAVAKLGHRPSERWLELVLMRAGDRMATFSPQHLANTLYALMLLRYMPPPEWLKGFYNAVSRRLHGFAPGELSHLCYAAGKLGLRPGRELLGGVLHHSLKHMQSYDVRELALLLYGVVHMGASLHADWLRVYRKRLTGLVLESGAMPQQLLEHLARQEAQPEISEIARAQLAGRGEQQQQDKQERRHQQERNLKQAQLQPQAHKPHAEGAILQQRSLEHQHYQPVVAGGGGAHGPLGGEANPTPGRGSAVGPAAPPRAVWVASYLPSVLSSLAEVGYRPPSGFMVAVLAAVGACAEQLTPVGLTTVLVSLANMRYRPHPALFRRVWNLLMDSMDCLDTRQSTIAVWACATLGCAAPRRDVHTVLISAATRLPDYSDGEVLQLLESVSALGFEPTTSWLELMESDLYNRLPCMQPQMVAALLLPLAGLHHRPHRLWMTRWAAAMMAGLPGLSLAQLAGAAYGAARLGFRPPSQLCSDLLAATAAGMAAAMDAASATAGTTAATVPDQPPTQCLNPHELEPGREPQVRQRRERPAWTLRLGDRSGGRLPETLSRLLWALAVLDIQPEEAWLAGYMACLRLVAGELSGQGRWQVVWALARLKHDPGPEWSEQLTLWRQELQQQHRQQEGGITVADGLAHEQTLTASGGPDGPAAAAAAALALEGPQARHRRSANANSSSNGLDVSGSLDKSTLSDALGSPPGSGAGVAGADTAGNEQGRGALRYSTSGAGVDLDTLVLQGMWDWAARQLGELHSEANPKRRAVARRR